MARYKDGADQDHKDAKRLAFNVQAGDWSVAGEQNRQDGRIVKAPGTDRVEGGDGNGYIITSVKMATGPDTRYPTGI